MLCIAGTDGYFKRLNPAWEKTLGYTQQRAGRAALSGLRASRGRAQDHRRGEGLRNERDVVQFENRYRARDGSLSLAALERHRAGIHRSTRSRTISPSARHRAGHRTRPPGGGRECRAAGATGEGAGIGPARAEEGHARQERIPGQHEPRDPHAHERHHRHDRTGARTPSSPPSSAST